MKSTVPLTPDALARVDQYDKMIAQLDRQLASGPARDERHAIQKSAKTLRHKIDEECKEALLREHGVAPNGRVYRVVRHDDGTIAAAVLDTAVGTP
jgi:hypothetical protein